MVCEITTSDLGKTMYAQLDIHFDEHPKYADLSLAHLGLIACAISYCNRLLTDGYVPASAMKGFGNNAKAASILSRKLIDSGIWEQRNGGVSIVGYLDHNPSKAEVTAKKARRLSKQTAYLERKRESFDRSNTGLTRPPCDNQQPVSCDLDVTGLSPSPSPSPSPNIFGANKSAAPKPEVKGQKRRTGIPDSEKLTEWAETWNLSAAQRENAQEFAKFVDHHRAKGSVMADWSAAWRTWERNAKRFSNERPSYSRLVQGAKIEERQFSFEVGSGKVG
jgi:hypothetical protein